MITLKGKTVLLTGASQGIGAATASVLLSAGADVILHYNSGVGKAANLREKFGDDRCLLIQADLDKSDAVDDLWQQALGWKGGIDCIVNNAAVMLQARPEDSLEDWRADWQKTLNVNVTAVADLCRYAIQHFLKAGGGSVVNIASRAAFRGDLPDSFHYAASKGAVVALTRSIAKAYAKDSIYAYVIAPGWVGTDRIQPMLDAPGNEFMLKEVPMGAAAPPEQIGNIVAFLLSGLATHATGGTFDINGASYFH